MGKLDTSSLREYSLNETAVFKVVDTAGFLWHLMDDAHVVYDPRSGHSQALNDFAREILALIEEKPRTVPEIMAEITTILGKSLDATLQKQICQTIRTFDNMGLIEPVKSDAGK